MLGDSTVGISRERINALSDRFDLNISLTYFYMPSDFSEVLTTMKSQSGSTASQARRERLR